MIKQNEKNLTILTTIFTIALVIANVVTSRMFATGINFFGTELVLPGAVFCYAITYLVTDVVGELWGKKSANQVVITGLIVQIMATVLIVLTGLLPTTTEEIKNAYDVILGQNAIFVVGSLFAYSLSQSVDVTVFHLLKNKFNGKHKWIRNNCSTIISQMVDTVVFIGISFGIGFGWLFNKEMLPTLLLMMLGQYLVKFLLAVIDTPIFYLLTSDSNSKNKDK